MALRLVGAAAAMSRTVEAPGSTVAGSGSTAPIAAWCSARLARAALCVLPLLIAGCAVLPRSDEAPLTGEALSGRLVVKVDADGNAAVRSVSAAFVLQGDARRGKLDLATPLGNVLARASWSPEWVALVTPQGERRFPDLDALTREVLGESLPVAALFDWLRGRPWPEAPSRFAEGGFEQLGWLVDLTRFEAVAAVDARRLSLPVVTVRARLDRSPS